MFASAWAVFWKDARGEWRSRASLNAIVLFAVCAPVALSFSLARQNLPPEAVGGLLWCVLLFAVVVGLPRTFLKEEESGTGQLLRLSCPGEAVLWGKSLWNLALLGVTQGATVPLFVLLLGARVHKPALLVVVLVLGDVGLAVSSALLGAIAAQAKSKGTLFAALAVPVLLPLLLAAASASASAFGAPLPFDSALGFLVAYDLFTLAAAWMLWEWVWK